MLGVVTGPHSKPSNGSGGVFTESATVLPVGVSFTYIGWVPRGFPASRTSAWEEIFKGTDLLDASVFIMKCIQSSLARRGGGGGVGLFGMENDPPTRNNFSPYKRTLRNNKTMLGNNGVKILGHN